MHIPIMNANTDSNVSRAKFLADDSQRQKLRNAVKHVLLSAPMEEWHPWQLRVEEEHVELSFQAGRQAADEDDRELMVRCGMALYELKLALKHVGCLGRVELFPDFDRADLVARFHCGRGGYFDAHEPGQFAAMTRGVAVRETPLDESALAMLQAGVPGEKAWLEFCQCDASRGKLAALAQSGKVMLALEPRPQTQPYQPRAPSWAQPLLTLIVRPGDPGHYATATGGGRADTMAALAAVKTKTDDKHGWLAAGQIIARARLEAKSLGISSQVFDRVFNHRRVREELRTAIGHKGFMQAIIGFGAQPNRLPPGIAAQQAAARKAEPGTNFPFRLDAR